MISFMLNSILICIQSFIGLWLILFSIAFISFIVFLLQIGWNELKIWRRKRNGK